MPTISRKLLVLGDSGCGKSFEPLRRLIAKALIASLPLGKSLLLRRFMKDLYPKTYFSHEPISYNTDVYCDGERVEITLCDMLAHDDNPLLKPLLYLNKHVILICFSIDSFRTLLNVEHHWLPEVLHFCFEKSVPYILVGCMKDLRNDEEAIERMNRYRQEFVTVEEGEEVAERIGAKMYWECSSKTGEGVKELFEMALRMSLKIHMPQICEDDAYTVL